MFLRVFVVELLKYKYKYKAHHRIAVLVLYSLWIGNHMIAKNSFTLQDLETNKSHIFDNLNKNEKIIVQATDSTLFLGNIENDKRSPKKHQTKERRYERLKNKYTRKHVASYALTVGNVTDNPKLQEQLKSELSDEELEARIKKDVTLKKINISLTSCGVKHHFGNVPKIVSVFETEETRYVTGVQSCGNISACTVCAAKLSAVRGNQLTEMIEAGRKYLRFYMFVTTTIPHKAIEELEITLNQVIDMSSYIFNTREYKAFKALTGLRFVHSGLENMVSFKNGLVDWHPHKNFLLDFDYPIAVILQKLGLDNDLELRLYVSNMFTRLGQRYLDKKNINKTLLKPYVLEDEKTKRKEVKGGVSATTEFDDEYITKWGLDAEMTAGIYKNGRIEGSLDESGELKKSFHPFVLLDFINQENKETSEKFKYQSAKAFNDFVFASRGKRWFNFGRGSVAYYNQNYDTKIKVKKDAEELAELEKKGEEILKLSLEEWKSFKPNAKKIGFALSLPTREEVVAYVYGEIEANRIKEKEEKSYHLGGSPP